MTKWVNKFKFLHLIVTLSKPNRPPDGFGMAAEFHAATRLPAFAPQNCFCRSLPRSAKGIIQTR